MIYTNTPWFPAILRLENGELLAEGEAFINRKNNSVTFTSDFVPLYPMKTEVEIVRLHEGKEIHKFFGKVYISDKKLMRITSVVDELLPGFENVYGMDMDFPISLKIISEEKPKRFSFFSKPNNGPIIFNAVITELNTEQVVFFTSYNGHFENEQNFIINKYEPIPLPKNTIIELKRSMLFGKESSHICIFKNLLDKDKEILNNFIIEFSKNRGKLL